MPRKASGKLRIDHIQRKQDNGDIYVYEVISKYNPEKKYNQQISSKLLGKIPAGSDKMIATRPRKKKEPLSENTYPGAIRCSVGTMEILDWVGKASGIDEDLLAAADKGTALKLISIARFWTANPDKTIRRIEEWQINHRIPYADGLSEDSCYLLMKELGQDASTSQRYFHFRATHASSRASVAVDTTTISSYSDYLNDVRYGYNKDGNGLPAIKLLTLYSTKDQQPVAFSRQPGNIPDVISVQNALKQLSVLNMEKPLVVLDGGFFSESNILEFIHAHTKVLMRAQPDCKWILPELEAVYDSMETPSNVCPFDSNVYGISKRISHVFETERKRTRNGIQQGDVVHEEHRIYLHFFLNTEKKRIEKAALMDDIQHVKEQIESGVDRALLSKAERNIADKFLLSRTYGQKLTVTLDDKAILKESKYLGFFVLIATEKMGTFEALNEYRLRERTEEGFRLDKQYNDAHVTRSKTTPSLEGRLFCQFVAFGYESFLQNAVNKMKRTLAVPNGDPEHDKVDNLRKEKALLNWLNKMSIARLMDWFDAIQETTVDTNFGKSRWRTETIERDRLFLKRLGVLKN